ncbi:unnamed protein product, partial [Cochlearia groenlandica]
MSIKMGRKHVTSKPSSSLAIVLEANPQDNKAVTIEAPIISSYNDRIRPLLDTLPMVMASSGEALMTLMDIIGSAKESLLKILIQGDFSEFPDDQKMHCTARLADMLSQFSESLQAKEEDVTEFLMDEIKVLEECKCVGLPNFIPRSAFLAILAQHIDKIH